MDSFQSIWCNEYIVEWSHGRSKVSLKNRLNFNDVVLVRNPLKPRPFWILGTVLELSREDSGVVRSARIKQRDGSVQVYSLKHLYSLELSRTSKVNRELIAPTSLFCDS